MPKETSDSGMLSNFGRNTHLLTASHHGTLMQPNVHVMQSTFAMPLLIGATEQLLEPLLAGSTLFIT